MGGKTMPITGGRACGAIRDEATEPPQEVGYCHCRMCQKATGNLFYPWAMFGSDAFRITKGEPTFYKSSALAERGFCANCGTQMAFHYLSDRVFRASIGSLDHLEDWPPSVRAGVGSQIPWLTIHDDLPRMRTEECPEFAAAKASTLTGVFRSPQSAGTSINRP